MNLGTLYFFIKVEPYWNVNVMPKVICVSDKPIKVEPYWNVNNSFTKMLTFEIIIKVEPYWNVNITKLTLSASVIFD